MFGVMGWFQVDLSVALNQRRLRRCQQYNGQQPKVEPKMLNNVTEQDFV
jgi:hypothetical protein